MNIKFKAKECCGDLMIESYEIKQETNVFNDIRFYLCGILVGDVIKECG